MQDVWEREAVVKIIGILQQLRQTLVRDEQDRAGVEKYLAEGVRGRLMPPIRYAGGNLANG
jgi:hypothetical protein